MLKEGRVAQIRDRGVAAKLSDEMTDPRDSDAAHTLVEMANSLLYLPKNELPSLRRNRGLVRTPAGKLSTTVLADGKRQRTTRFLGDGKMKTSGERSSFRLMKTINEERKERKRKLVDNFSKSHIKKYRTSYIREEEEQDENTNSFENSGLSNGYFHNSCLSRKCREHVKTRAGDVHERFVMEHLERKRATKSRKAKSDRKYLCGHDVHDCLLVRSQKLIDDPSFLKKKSGLQKLKAKRRSLCCGKIYASVLSEKEDRDGVVPVTKSAKKQQLSLITSTIHTGFSFSIIHLLSAVRAALITPHSQYYASVSSNHVGEGNTRERQCNDIQKKNPEGVNGFYSHEGGVMNGEQIEQTKLPSLTIDEIVQRVRLKHGDPSILETKEPLQDLARGVLNIFSSKTAPPGATGWKALTVYEKTSKRWSWVGPVLYSFPHYDHIEDEITSEAWGIPHRTLMKLVDCFANWLKQGQEMLQQIGSLPAPPVILMQPTNMNERFKDMRALRSLSTINPSCDEVRAYFRKEEALRYLIPERAFSYTALDGRKSAVAPLRRCGGKPSVKARNHFMLKHNRPPHVTVLCLVRDAAARLPGSIGTRADVCTLVRDSQFVMEDISDLQVNQVVSGALDRLHYEFDPCVQFDRDRHLWVYLHGDRKEENFMYDCTSSRKKGRQIGEMWQGELA